MSKQKTELMSVRILPNTSSTPAGKLADAEVIFEAGAGPFTGMKLVGFAIWWIGFGVLGIWAIYRIARGWLRLQDRRMVS